MIVLSNKYVRCFHPPFKQLVCSVHVMDDLVTGILAANPKYQGIVDVLIKSNYLF